MRVAMIVNTFPEISQKFIITQAAGLIDAGVDLDIFAAIENQGGKGHALSERYRLKERCVFALVPRSTKSRLRAFPGLFAHGLARNPAGALAALHPRYATTSRNLKNLYFLRAFEGRHYDLIHSHFGPNGLIGAFLKDRGVARALVTTFHGSDITTYPRRHGKKVYRVLYDRADVVTAGTGFTRGRLVANGCPEAKIEILPVGVRAEDYPETPPAARLPFSVLSVGRLVEVKGYRYALEALAKLTERFPDLEYLIAGEGSERATLERLAAQLGVARSVRFLGAQTDKEVAALYSKAAVFVLSSVVASDGAEEGQGLVLQEAQACGIPVVATSIGGIPEGVRDGETGFLVPQKDPAALADRISRLLADPALRQRMGSAGRGFATANYGMTGLTRRLVAIYERSLTSSS